MRLPYRMCVLSFVALICAGEQPPPATNQAAPEVTSSQAPAVFRSSANLVQVPVVARDAGGHAVGSLRAEDFQLFDGGKPQAISRFSVEKFQTNESLQTRTRSPIPGAGAAEVVTGTLPDRFVALLMDDVNTPPVDFVSGRNAALHYIDTLPPEVRVAVYSTSGNKTLDFTGDRDQLRKALLSINAPGGTMHYVSIKTPKNYTCVLEYYTADLIAYHDLGWVICGDHEAISVGTIATLVTEVKHSLDTYADPNELAYFKALSSLVGKMSVLPGQRSIMVVSPGQYVPERFQPRMNEVLSGAIRAKVVINGLDARGVFGSFDTAGERLTPVMPSMIELGEQQEREFFMDNLTSGTGGTFVHGNNDLDGAIQRAESIPEYVYLLSFSPSELRLDGKQHNLKVTLKNPRGLTLQARSSYYAASYSGDPADQVKQQIEEAFFSSQELNGLPVRLQTQFFKDGDSATLTVTARVDATKLPFRKKDGRNRDDLTLVVGLFDQNGNYVSAYQKAIEMRLKDETLDAWMKSGNWVCA